MAFNADVCVTLPGSFLALAQKAIVRSRAGQQDAPLHTDPPIVANEQEQKPIPLMQKDFALWKCSIELALAERSPTRCFSLGR
jgi:hypothetical protein